ncbi:MAG: NADP-dependent malic enzyme [Trebonia sp.]|jgi:malate dehydrogenase (oxaloacetate-decarboxylating)|uniref:NAD(P)-dependent malic enzyme n=2 Tax=Trebonia sp. TaxID=2767075 RepID=UPI002B95F020|nr:NADP-dependent malic enzyme [Trebonia sp.]HTB54054.1 NADP-dependent malic enzyme [Trebonia sp.]
MHRGGKIDVRPTVDVPDRAALAMAYTPGVARVCSAIADQPELASEYTWTGNTVAVVSDGTAVLGLGDIGPAAAMPVMEGKALLFKRFAGINAVPVCIACTDVDEVVRTVAALAPSFGGINLEDISAPRCFEIEDRLRAMLDIPVFHDDQHGTAIVTLAALRGAARVVGKGLGDLRVVVCGAGASGIAVSKILLSAGVGDIAVADSKGLIYDGRDGLNPVKAALAKVTNAAGLAGSPEAALRGADVFIGLSGSTLAEEAIARMAPGAIAFLLSNPDPEIHPDVARRHVAVVATGRSDFPNQINNSLAFPGVFRAALDVRASTVTERMKLAAADAIAALVGGDAAPDYVIPSQFDERVAPAVAAAVAAAARADGVARR